MLPMLNRKIKITPELSDYVEKLIGNGDVKKEPNVLNCMVSNLEQERVERTKEIIVDQIRIFYRTQYLLPFIPLVLKRKIPSRFVDLASLEVSLNSIVINEIKPTLRISNLHMYDFWKTGFTKGNENILKEYKDFGMRLFRYSNGLMDISQQRTNAIKDITQNGSPSSDFVKKMGTLNPKSKSKVSN